MWCIKIRIFDSILDIRYIDVDTNDIDIIKNGGCYERYDHRCITNLNHHLEH
jgi:hypothetical protein